MTEINALSRTQRVVVNQANSGKVTVISAGPIGPSGPQGLAGGGSGFTWTAPSSSPPTANADKETWYETDTGSTYISISDSWIEYGNSGSGAGGFTFVQDETSPPGSPSVGDTWFAPDTGFSYLRYFDGVSAVWLQVGGVAQIYTASEILIEDSGDLYTSTNVETALAEVKAIADAGAEGLVVSIDGGDSSTTFS